MTTKHLAILCAVVVGTFSLVYVLPQQLGYQPTGIVLKLPEYLGAWWGKTVEPTQQEREVLVDSDFAKRNYLNGSGDRVFVSVVLAGQDMMTGIHRPERCLQAQGWTTGHSSIQRIEIPGYGRMKATRLQTAKLEPVVVPAGEPPKFVTVQSVSYYWFIGYNSLAASHEERVFMDFRDRVFHGYNQRWAMVMLTSEITVGLQRFGRDEKQVDEQVVDFIQQLTPKLLGESFQRHASTGRRLPLAPIAALGLAGAQP